MYSPYVGLYCVTGRKHQWILHECRNERDSDRSLTSVPPRRPRWRRNTGTQLVCVQEFLDHNKLMGFTSHILFMLSDGVAGSLRSRRILPRTPVFGLKKLLPARPRWCNFVWERHLFLFLSRPAALRPEHKPWDPQWLQSLMQDCVSFQDGKNEWMAIQYLRSVFQYSCVWSITTFEYITRSRKTVWWRQALLNQGLSGWSILEESLTFLLW